MRTLFRKHRNRTRQIVSVFLFACLLFSSALSCQEQADLIVSMPGAWLRSDGRSLNFHEDGSGYAYYGNADNERSTFVYEQADNDLLVYYQTKYLYSLENVMELILIDESGNQLLFFLETAGKLNTFVGSWQYIFEDFDNGESELDTIIWKFYDDGTGIMDYVFGEDTPFRWSADEEYLILLQDLPEIYHLNPSSADECEIVRSDLVSLKKTEGLDSSIRGIWVNMVGDVYEFRKDGTGNINENIYFSYEEKNGELIFLIGKTATRFKIVRSKEDMTLQGPILTLVRQKEEIDGR